MAHAVLNILVDVAHAEGPVRHAHGQTIDGHLGHELRRHQLEIHWVVVQALGLRQRLQLAGVGFELLAHGLRSRTAV